MINGFLLGIIVACSITAGAFFIKFWRQTRDTLFLAFGAAFLIEGFNRSMILFVARAQLGPSCDLCGALVILFADPGRDHQ